MSSGLLRLVFPQWQGSGNRKDVYYGAKLIRDEFLKRKEYEEVRVSLNEDLELENGILGYHQIHDNLNRACEILVRTKPDKIFLIGGDCGTEAAPVSYLNMKYNGDLAVLWLDAHGDLNSPSTTTSNRFHGMPLRCLLGDGDEALVKKCFSTLCAEQVVMGGIRDLDPPEEKYIRENSIDSLTVSDITNSIEKAVQKIKDKGYHNLYIHIDVDVLDPDLYPWMLCPSENGLKVADLLKLIAGLKENFNLTGAGIVEVRPAEDMDLTALRELVDSCDFSHC